MFFYLLSIFILNITLVKFFIISEYLLYFIFLFFSLFIFCKYIKKPPKIELFSSIFLILLTYPLYNYFQDNIFDFYIWSGISDRVDYMSSEVVYILSFLHSFMLLLMGFKKN